VFISGTFYINSPAVYFTKNRNFLLYFFLTPGQVIFWTFRVNVPVSLWQGIVEQTPLVSKQRGASLPLAPVILKNQVEIFFACYEGIITSGLFSGPNLQNQMLVNSVKRFPGQKYQTISTQRDNLTLLSIDQ
jgi:hypothetical protein